MLNKINITIGVLAVIALVSFLSLLDTLGAIKVPDLTAVLGSSSLAPIESDSDGDGLTNNEESYWRTDFMNPDTDADGFLDGEEVKSGHNPLVPGPNDLLVTNLTEGTSEIIASGIVEGSLKPDSENYTESLTTLINDVEYQFLLSVAPTIYSPQVVSTNKQTVQKYINEISIVESMFKKEGDRILRLYDTSVEVGLFDGKLKNQSKNYENFQEFMLNEIVIMQSDLDKLKKIETPDTFVNNHSELVYFFEKILKSYESLRLSSQDPIRASFSFMTIYGLFTEDLPALFEKQIESLNLMKSR